MQTTISDELHKKLVEISKSERRSIKEIVRESIEDWLIWRGEIREDPFFRLKPVDFGVETNARRLKAVLYGRPK